MGKVSLTIDDNLESAFRKTAIKKYGMKRGNLALAIEQAFISFIDVYASVEEKDEIYKLTPAELESLKEIHKNRDDMITSSAKDFISAMHKAVGK